MSLQIVFLLFVSFQVCLGVGDLWPSGNHQIIIHQSGLCYESRQDWLWAATCSDNNPDQGFVYNPQDRTLRHDNACVKVEGTHHSALVRVGTCAGHYQWRVAHGAHGLVFRLVTGNNHCIDARGFADKHLTPIQLWTCETFPTSDHFVKPGVQQPNHEYCKYNYCSLLSSTDHKIVVAKSNYCYEVKNDFVWNEPCVSKKPEQGFIFNSYDSSIRYGQFCLKVDRPDNGVQLRIGECSGHYQWVVEKGSHGVRIRLRTGVNKCIDVLGAFPRFSAKVVAWSCEDFPDSDHWIRSEKDDYPFHLKLK